MKVNAIRMFSSRAKYYTPCPPRGLLCSTNTSARNINNITLLYFLSSRPRRLYPFQCVSVSCHLSACRMSADNGRTRRLAVHAKHYGISRSLRRNGRTTRVQPLDDLPDIRQHLPHPWVDFRPCCRSGATGYR